MRGAGYPAAAVGLSLVVGLSGCALQLPSGGGAAPSAPRPGAAYVDVRAYLPLHPAAPRLAEMERALAWLESPRPAPAGVPEDLDAPPPEEPAAERAALPRPLEAPNPPDLDRERARRAIREEFELRRLAEPDPGEAAYREALDRAAEEAVAKRPSAPPSPEALARYRAEGERLAEASRRLREQLRALEERPADRLFYTPAQLRRRRETRALLEAELEALRRREIERLRRAVELPEPPPAPLPEERHAEAEAARAAARKAAAERLRQLEQQELARLAALRLPAPAPERAEPPRETAPGGTAAEAARARIVARIEAEPAAPPEPLPTRPGAAMPPALSAERLARRRSELLAVVLEDLRAAAQVAGRARGLVVRFEPGAGPDRTEELRPAVRALLGARGAEPAERRARGRRSETP